jgi:hypothetical protein
MHAYIVQTKDGYLYPFAGDVSLTDREDQAGHYLSTGEANDAAERLGYKEGTFRVIAVDVDDAKLIRH